MYLRLLDRNVKEGIINLHLPSGRTHRFGNYGLEVDWIIHDEETIHRIARDWEYQLGETYVQGGWDAGDNRLYDLLYILRSNFKEYSVSNWLRPLVRLAQQ